MTSDLPTGTARSVLPDVRGLEGLPQAVWEALGQKCREAGLRPGALDPRGGPRSHPWSASSWTALRQLVLQDHSDPRSLIERVFNLRDSVPLPAMHQWLGGALLDRLLDAGLLMQPTADTVMSPFDLRLFRGLLILCDDLTPGGNAVFGIGPGTTAFHLPSTPRQPIRSALDLGCGAGAVSLWLASHVTRVVGSDINPRALVLAGVNAALNGVFSVEWRLGDLFEPVSGERFDWIATQPPYVPRPPASSLAAATYLHGGRLGNELLNRLVSALPRHLSDYGFAQLVFDQPWFGPSMGGAWGWPFDSGAADGLCTLAVLGAPLPAPEYALRQVLAGALEPGPEPLRAELRIWIDHLARAGVTGVSPAVALIGSPQDDPSTDTPAWHVVLQAGQSLWNELGPDTLDRLWQGHHWLKCGPQSRARLGGRIQVPAGGRVIRGLSTERGQADALELALPPDYLFGSVSLSQSEWTLLQQMSAGGSPGSAGTDELMALAAGLGFVHV